MKPLTAAASSEPAAGRKALSSDALLLQATGEILSERNSLDVSLSDIAQRSGLNTALIKYYFGNKDGLLLALVKRDATNALRELEHLVALDIPADRKMRIHISGIINSYYRSPYLNRLLHYLIGDGDSDASRKIAEFFVQPIVDAQRAILKQGEAEGIFRPCDPELFYFSLVGACDHIFYAIYSLKHVLGISGLTEELRQRYIAHVTEISLSGLTIR
jgi:AcrR family transcriptional regulator